MNQDQEKLKTARPVPPPGKELVEGPWKFIVDEHDVNDPKTGEYAFTVTAADLEAAAAKGNARILATGDFSPLTLGHTVDGQTEDKQPGVVGFAGPFEVRPLYDTGRKAIAAKEWYYADWAPKIEAEYQRRSVEVTWAKHLIDPIAVLGATTPARDLGLQGMRYSLSGDPTARKVRYQMFQVNPQVSELLAAFLQTDVGQLITQIVREKATTLVENPAPAVAPAASPVERADAAVPTVAEPPQEPSPPVAPFVAADDKPAPQTAPLDPPVEPKKERQQMADTSNPSTASSTNVAPPAPIGDKERERAKYYHKMAESALDAGETEHYNHCVKMSKQFLSKYSASGDDTPNAPRIENQGIGETTGGSPATTVQEEKLSSSDEKLRMQMSQQAIQLRQYEERDRQREEEVRNLKLRNQRSDRERDLIQLEAGEGIQFDRAEELDFVQAMDEESYQKHLARMKSRYARAPINGRRIEADPNPHNLQRGKESPDAARERTQRAVDLATKEGIPFDAALARVSAKV